MKTLIMSAFLTLSATPAFAAPADSLYCNGHEIFGYVLKGELYPAGLKSGVGRVAKVCVRSFCPDVPVPARFTYAGAGYFRATFRLYEQDLELIYSKPDPRFPNTDRGRLLGPGYSDRSLRCDPRNFMEPRP